MVRQIRPKRALAEIPVYGIGRYKEKLYPGIVPGFGRRQPLTGSARTPVSSDMGKGGKFYASSSKKC